jgi:hypothetical protein
MAVPRSALVFISLIRWLCCVEVRLSSKLKIAQPAANSWCDHESKEYNQHESPTLPMLAILRPVVNEERRGLRGGGWLERSTP